MDDYDKLFGEFYRFEYDKIPNVMRFSKKRLKIIAIIMCACFLVAAAISYLMPMFRNNLYMNISSPTGGQYRALILTTYNNTLLILFIIFMSAVAVLAAWSVAANHMERKAFRIASHKAAEALEFKRKREKEEWLEIRKSVDMS